MFHVPGFIDAPFAFPLRILVPHGELIPSSFLNKEDPLSQISRSSLLKWVLNRGFTVQYALLSGNKLVDHVSQCR